MISVSRYILLPLTFILVLSFCSKSTLAAKYAAFVIDAHTGHVLHADNAYASVYPASLTKVATLYMLFEAISKGKVKFDTKIKISYHAARQIPSKLGLPVGASITVRDAILALVTKSANDIAVAVAEHLGGSEAIFSQHMTYRMRRLGLKDTTFKNASGVPNKFQTTTAADMAKLLQIVIRDYPAYYKRYFGQKSFTYRGIVHLNHNRLLGKVEGLDGGKTGFICASGFNISTSAVREGKRLIAVVMGGETPKRRDQRVSFLLNRGFDRFKKYRFNEKESDPREFYDYSSSSIALPFPENLNALDSKEIIHDLELPQAKPVNYSRSQDKAESSYRMPHLDHEEVLKIYNSSEKAKNRGNWGVQIGSFKDANQAHMAAAHLLSKIPADIEGQISISKAIRKQGHPYRARLIGFSQKAAYRVCNIIESHGTPCLPFQIYRGEKIYTAMNSR